MGTDDLDGDGIPDELWLARDADLRILGISTASGARFSISLNAFDAGALEQRVGDTATAISGRLGDGSAVVLVDLGRSAALYGVVNCYLVATTNAQGHPYLFDLGYDQTGNGVGCPVVGSRRVLAGYLADYDSKDETYRVTRTTIDLDAIHRRATAGRSTVLATSAPENSAVVRDATSVTCGDNEPVTEPAP
ncbi:hypothetical protein GCM10022223_53830 [Kineosporia mesophila]|uniref:Uncharacterized protein n=1 Tax=Kineosporia mesophila TaxID=566012 RepID=A0ABP7AD12_9ACTN|nr:hypothetical protein [Kineosporia mesophila]MCD5351238.1 hypothetical protein [Kineosporia mesophila]